MDKNTNKTKRPSSGGEEGQIQQRHHGSVYNIPRLEHAPGRSRLPRLDLMTDVLQRTRESRSGGILAALRKYKDPQPPGDPADNEISSSKSDNDNLGSTLEVDSIQSGDAEVQEAVQGRSWLERLTGAYSAAERQIAWGAKALQKLAVPPSRSQDYERAKAELELSALQMRGRSRLALMQHWLDLVSRAERPVSGSEPVIVTQPATPPASEEGDEEDWQQLSALPVASKSTRGSGQEAGQGASPRHSLGFRDVFLRSNALQHILAGYAKEPPGSEEEEEILQQLLQSCCRHGSEEILGTLLSLSRAQRQCSAAGVAQEPVQAIADSAATSIACLKRQASVEAMEGRMDSLREEFAEQAATAALLHKFNSGASNPTGEVTRARLEQGLAATKEVMLLGEALCRLAESKTEASAEAAAPDYMQIVDGLQTRSLHLSAEISAAEQQLDENQHQQDESKSFRKRKVEEMGGSVLRVQEEIQDLQKQRAALLTQLEAVELSLAKSQAKKADLDEGRSVFEEGNNFTIQALEQQAADLATHQMQYESEVDALGKCQQLVERAQHIHDLLFQEQQDAHMEEVSSAAQEYCHAATRHLYFQRAQLQLLLRQLHFCINEMAGSSERQKHVAKLGMDQLLSDVAVQTHRLMQQYLDAENAFQNHLKQVEEVHETVQSIQHRAMDYTPHNRCMQRGKELEELVKSIEELKATFDSLERPLLLPKPGQKLPQLHGTKIDHEDASPGSSQTLSASSQRTASDANDGSAQSGSPEKHDTIAAIDDKINLLALDAEQTESLHHDLGLDLLLASQVAEEGSGDVGAEPASDKAHDEVSSSPSTLSRPTLQMTTSQQFAWQDKS